MDASRFERIDDATFFALAKAAGLYREDDVTFDQLEGPKYRFVGDDFAVDPSVLEGLELECLFIEGSVRADQLSVGDLLDDYGVICVTGDLACTDLFYATESTALMVGGNLSVGRVFYADCGNSVLQVNGDLRAKIAHVAQCLVDVGGEEEAELDDEASLDDLAAAGLDVSGHEEVYEVIEAIFEAHGE